MFSYTEENYLKAIYHLSNGNLTEVTTNDLAEFSNTKPASVSDMLKKLADKKVILYKKYQGVKLSSQGKTIALDVIRKHRLWEVFLVEKLGFKWDEVHEIAEQLEHIHSVQLIDKLESYLQFPTKDPHGDPIPSKEGVMPNEEKKLLSEVEIGFKGKICGLTHSSASFLQYLNKFNIKIGSNIKVLSKMDFDHSIEVTIASKTTTFFSKEVASNIYVA
jgi:DtxR family Mn-dependent transcriptional regulator